MLLTCFPRCVANGENKGE